MPGSRAADLGQDHQRFLQDHDERARARPAGQAARDAAIMDSYPRSDLRVLVRLFPGHDGQSDDCVLQQPRDRPARDLPADFCRGYRGPKIAYSIEAADRRRLALPSAAICRHARLNAVARHYRVRLASDCRRVRRPACDRRFGAITREMIPERVEDAQREAGPDRRTEIKRHPGNLVLPLGKVVRHDPTRADVAETLERPQKLAATGNLGPPPAQIHRDVDGHEKRQIARNPCYRADEDHAYRTTELRQQPAKANPDDEESNGPYRIFDGVAPIVGGQHRIP